MKLHLPKALFTAVMALFAYLGGQAYADNYSLSDATADTDITYNTGGYLIYDKGDTNGIITYTGDIDLAGTEVWTGPGTGTSASITNGQATLVEMSGVLSGTNKLKLNSWGGNVVYELSNSGNTFSGQIDLAHGQGANHIVQLSLTANSVSSAKINFENKDKNILSIEAAATVQGIMGGSDTSLVAASSTANVLTLAGTGTYTYAGKIGSGSYISSDASTFTTSSTANLASTAVSIAKTGTGTQTFSGTVNLHTVTVSAGTLELTGTSTVNTATVSGGTLNLSGTSNGGSYTASDSGAINVGALTVSSGTLSLSGAGTVLSKTITNNATLSVSGVTISDLSGFDFVIGTLDKTQGTGLQSVGSSYQFVKGSGTATGTVTYGGNTYNIADGISDAAKVYYVAADDTTATSTDAAAATATTFVVDGTLTVDGDTNGNLTASAILASATGSGNLVLATETSLSGETATQLSGKLTLQDTLNFGSNGALDPDTVSVSSFSSVEFDGGTFKVNNDTAALKNVTVTSNGGTIHSQDMGAKTDNKLISFEGTTTLNGDLKVTSYYNAQMQIAKLTGAGNLVFDGAAADEEMSFNIQSAEDYSGTVKVVNTAAGLKLTVAANAGVDVLYTARNGKEISLSMIGAGNTVTLNGATGWLSKGTTAADIVFTNTTDHAGLEMTDGSSGASYGFSGSVSGTGNFVINKNLGDAKMTFTFSGDVEDWSGVLVSRSGNNDITFTGNATSIKNATIAAAAPAIENVNKSTTLTFDHAAAATVDSQLSNSYWGYNGILHVAVTNTATEGTTFNGTITADSLTVNDGTLATITNTGSVGDLTVNGSGTVKVTGSGSLTYGGNTTVTAPVSQSLNTVTSGAEITSTAITGGVVTFTGNADVTESRTISDSAIVNNATGTANISVGAQNASVNAAAGNIAMTTTDANGTTVGDLTVATGKEVSSTGNLTVTDTLTISGMDALSVTGALTLDNATVNLTGLTLAQDQTIYTLGSASSISTNGVTVQLTEDQLTAAGFDIAKTTYTVGAAADDATSLVLTLTVEPAEPALTTINVEGVDVAKSSAGVLTLTTAENATDAVFGGALDAVMDDTTWADIKAELKEAGITLNDSIAITFVGADGVAFDFGDNGETQMAITINGEVTRDDNLVATNPILSGDGAAAGTIVGNYVTAYIPEPTSTTLSLLALAALAVRRRRK